MHSGMYTKCEICGYQAKASRAEGLAEGVLERALIEAAAEVGIGSRGAMREAA